MICRNCGRTWQTDEAGKVVDPRDPRKSGGAVIAGSMPVERDETE